MRKTKQAKETSKQVWDRSLKMLESIEFAESRQSLAQRNRRTRELVRKAIQLFKKETNQPMLTDRQVALEFEKQESKQ